MYDFDKLKNFEIFAHITAEDLETMLSCHRPVVKEYERGQFINVFRSDNYYIGVIISGSVQMIIEDAWGNKSILAEFTEGEIFGENYACSEEEKCEITFQSNGKCRILFMDYWKILHRCTLTCKFHHRLIENMIEIIARKNIMLIKKIDVISKMTLREKIITFLSHQVQQKGSNEFNLDFGRVKMAEYLCTDRSALTRELSKMADDGLIEYDKNYFKVLF